MKINIIQTFLDQGRISAARVIIYQDTVFADHGAIYGEFKPDSYHSYYGQIVRISLDGGMQVYDSREARSAYQTTGDDVLELIAVEDGKIYCYWHDCSVSGGQASILWTRPLVLG